MHARRFRPVPLLLLLATTACARQPQTLRDLLRRVATTPEATAKTALVEQFIAGRPNPIIEQNARLVFFVRDDDTGRVPRLVGDFNAWSAGAAIPLMPLGPDASRAYNQQAGTPIRIQGTPWSYVETSGYSNSRIEYVLLYEKEAVPDPRNPRRVRTFVGERSEVRMPAFVPHPELDDPLPAARGVVTEEAFPSRLLQGTRRIWTYLPAGYDANQNLYPVAYVLDGGNYVGWMEAPAVLDRLIAAKRVPPFIAVFVEPASRQEEYSRSPAWRAFMTTELIPAIDKRFRTFPAPEQRLIFGSSLAAYGAVDLAVAAPDVFGLCAAIAPPPQTLTLITNQVEGERAIHGVRFYVLGAQYDTDVAGARTLRSALVRASADARYDEVPEGHAAETFRGYLGNALAALLPGPPT